MDTTLTIIAIIAGPILAIQVQKLLERITQRRDEKRRVFMILMTTRDERILREHVQALNMIDVTFAGRSKKNRAVVEAWAEYREHLNSYPYPQESSGKQLSEPEQAALKSKRDSWSTNSTELLIKLLDKMAVALNYHFDKVLLKKGAYTPSGYGEDFAQNYAIRRGLLEILYGKPILVNIVGIPATERTEPSQKATPEELKQESPPEKPKQA